MAQITGTTQEKIFQMKRFYGLNENPDGDTKLKFGEAAVMRNFCVTRDGNLKKRPGTKSVADFDTQYPVVGLWSGDINGKAEVLAACNDHLYKLWDDDEKKFIAEDLGYVNTDTRVHIFGFGGIAYIMDGTQYLCYDGTMLDSVDGYRPLVTITVPPDGGGETLEQVNKLNGSRRSWFSPDGEKATFVLPENHIKKLDYVAYTRNGVRMEKTEYTADLEAGTVTFNTAPAKGVNTIEIGWTVAESDRAAVEQMRFSELFNGTQDTRVFIYGNGTNEAFYSGLDYDGRPRADYFPDMNEIAVGDANTPITSMVRHYSTLVAFKTHSTWRISYGNITLADGMLTPAFYSIPVNRTIGNAAPGQANIVLNSPRTVFGSDLYEWRSNVSYNGNLTSDERQAHRISDRIYSTLGAFDSTKATCFDDNPKQEYYICYKGRTLVHNYAVDAWYEYTGLKICSMLSFNNETYIGTADGKVLHLSENYLSDDGEPIDCYWESGSMSFGSDYMRKYSAVLWVGTKPQESGEVYVTVQTDRKSEYTEKVISSQLSSFRRLDFTRFNFYTNWKPTMEKLKIKAKKFVFYKLIFKSNSYNTTTTVLTADIRVRFTGYAR